MGDAVGANADREPTLLARARRALTETNATMGALHGATLKCVYQYAVRLEADSQLLMAESMYHRCYCGGHETLGRRHAMTLRARHGLATVLYAQARRALRKRRHTSRLGLSGMRGRAERCANPRGLLREARQHYAAAAEGRATTLGAHHLATLASLQCLACVVRATGDICAAERLHRTVLVLKTAALGARHVSTLTSAVNLGALILQQRRYGAAVLLLGTTLEGCAATLGATHARTRRVARLHGRAIAGDAAAAVSSASSSAS